VEEDNAKELRRPFSPRKGCYGSSVEENSELRDDLLVDDMEMTVSKELFHLVIQDREVQRLMDELDIPPDRAHLFDILDADGSGGIQVQELVQGLLKVRGEARRSDIIGSLLAVRAVQDMVRELHQDVSLALSQKPHSQLG